ncbi:Glycoside hydrolase family 79 protein [Mycena venus]|uniref:Glycoside hydrolase family 79 protein n=1 Tax=Mycena venus TaxID=2733690 RepID=A0A8H6XVX3_9AGAR|nr:Glycoside hydrolase family 79 protein [Mycena venus]
MTAQLAMASLALTIHLWMAFVFAIDIPASPPSTHTVVSPNFLGVSFELSSVTTYFGNDTSTIPQPMVNYIAGIRARTGDASVRLRIGGNSADSSIYVESQTSPMAVPNGQNANADDQSINYGPVLFEALAKMGQMAGGADYLFSVPLLNPNGTIPKLVADAKGSLGDSLNALLLGNEPDLYQAHKERPNIANYTVAVYETEFSGTVDILQSTFDNFAGPTICCSWNLVDVLNAGYLSKFALKYVTLQHYPQNFCPGLGMEHQQFFLPYYMQHSNVVTLAAWQSPAYQTITKNNSANAPRLVLSEFNSASCGGIPGLSDTFAVGGLWIADYALQLASVGYTAAYAHTREPGITYNLVTPPAGGNGNWTTNPPYYATIAIAEALRTDNGGIVVDLNLSDSTQAGYAVYDAKNSSVTRLILFNYASEPTQFTLPVTVFAGNAGKTALVKFLASASGANETTNVSWGGKTFAGVGDGKSAIDATWAGAPQNLNLQCTDGCNFNATGVSMAVVFLDNAQFAETAGPTTSGSSASPQATNSNSAPHISGLALGAFGTVFVATAVLLFLM